MYLKLFNSLIKTDQYKCNYYCQKEIITSGECLCKKVYLIKNGVVKVSSLTEKGEEIILVVLTNGQVFGANPILENFHHNYIYESLNEKTILYEFDIDCIQKLIKENHFINKDLLIVLGNQYSELERRIKTLCNNNAEQRLVNVLIEFKEKFEQTIDNEENIIISMPLNQEEISKYIRVTRVTINKIVNEFKKKLLIESNQKTIVIKKSFFKYHQEF